MAHDWKSERLISGLLQTADAEVDALVADYERHLEGPPAVTLIPALVTECHAAPETRREPVATYLSARPPLPSWADDARMRIGQGFFVENFLGIAASWLVGSLPTGYACDDVARVLSRTTRLERDARLRVVETAVQMFEVARLDELRPGGRAYQSARQLRLLHAGVRRAVGVHHLDATSGHPEGRGDPWDDAAWGRPANQLDLLGTLWTFALTPLHALDASGITIDPDEADAYVHMWNVFGAVMGVGADPPPDGTDLLEIEREEAEVSFTAIKRFRYGAGDEGRRLAAALMDMLEELVGPGWRWLPEKSVRYYDPEVAGLLGLGGPTSSRLWPAVRKFWRVASRYRFPKLAAPFQRALVTAMLDRYLLEEIDELTGAHRSALRPAQSAEELRHGINELLRPPS
jgi:ER-bound oxygenase mpaB/B'/Rubber oxygenase, catalytic domain